MAEEATYAAADAAPTHAWDTAAVPRREVRPKGTLADAARESPAGSGTVAAGSRSVPARIVKQTCDAGLAMTKSANCRRAERSSVVGLSGEQACLQARTPCFLRLVLWPVCKNSQVSC